MTAPAELISVVVPSYNAGDDLRRCLAALFASDWPAFEVIVADDASGDDSARRFAEQHGAKYLRLEQNSGPAVARNEAAKLASGSIIMTVDADVLVHRDTLRKAAEVFAAEPQLGALFGSYDTRPTQPGFLSQYRNLLHHWVHQTGNPEANTFWTGCGAIRRSVFEELGGFDNAFERPCMEDIELGYRIHAAGYPIRLVKNMQCSHMKRWTLGNMLKTDTFQRAVPWLMLLLQRPGQARTLNNSIKARVATVAAALLVPTLLAALFQPQALWLAALLVGLVVAMQWGFYTYVARLRGPWFALRVIPAQLLFYLCCAVAIPIAYWRHWRGMPPA